MVGEKFFDNLYCLSPSELNSCIRLSNNSYFNKRDEITICLELFKKNKKKFFSALLDEKKMFYLLFSDEKVFSRKILLDHFYYCQLFFEEFIIQNTLQKDKQKRLEILQDFYSKNNNTKEALIVNKQLHKMVDKKKVSINNYYQKYLLHFTKFNFLVTGYKNEIFENVELAMEQLDKFYFLAKLNLNQELQSNKLHNKREYDVVLMEEIKSEIKKNPELAEDFCFQIFKLTSNLYSGKGNDIEYFILKNIILDNLDAFDAKNQRALLIDLSNYSSIMYSRNGDVKLLSEFFEIYKLKHSYGLEVDKVKTKKNDFNQIINVAVYLEEFDWATDFLDENEKYIDDKTSIILSRAQIAYKIEAYDKVLNLLKDADIRGYSQNSLAKTIYAKTLYCSRNFDLLEPHLKAFELYMRRQKNIDERLKDKNLRFVLYFKRLLKNMYNKDRLEKLMLELDEDKTVHNRNWLIARVKNAL